MQSTVRRHRHPLLVLSTLSQSSYQTAAAAAAAVSNNSNNHTITKSQRQQQSLLQQQQQHIFSSTSSFSSSKALQSCLISGGTRGLTPPTSSAVTIHPSQKQSTLAGCDCDFDG